MFTILLLLVLKDVCSTCHTEATCDNKTDGSGKTCNCKFGFFGNGRSFCFDKDECQLGPKICGPHTTCHNTYGSYYCTCSAGYSPTNLKDVFIPNDGTSCKDVDECSMYGPCGGGAQCRNLPGTFECSCMLGYRVHGGIEPFHPPTDGASCTVVDCGPPAPVDPLVLLSVTETLYGGVATFRCAEGLVARGGDSSSVCGADGLWVPPTFHCQDVDECSTMAACGGGAQCKNLPGTFECKCMLGYRVHDGIEPFHPPTDGASCRVVDCGPPTPADLTVLLSVTQTLYGGIATFACSKGLVQRDGDRSSVCGADGLWGPPTIVCEGVNCGPPPKVPHARVVSSSSGGTEVLYGCDHGYQNVGGNIGSVCGATGRWEEPQLLCQEISCGRPPALKASRRLWDGSSSPGSTAWYVCEDGFYEAGGQNQSECGKNAQWTQPSLACREKSCGDPPTLPHTGRVWNGSSTPGSRVSYYCKQGFYSSGEHNQSVCTVDGLWTNVSVSCRATGCGEPPLLPNAVPLWDGDSTFGSQLVYECAWGFRSAANVSVCTDTGNWDVTSVLCEEVTCGPPLSHPHTRLQWDGTSQLGSEAQYECVAGFYQQGAANVSICLRSGLWTNVSIQCKAQCGPAPSPAHSRVVWHNSSVVVHCCENGYDHQGGTNVSVCQDSGKWQEATLTCAESTPPISHLEVQHGRCFQWRADRKQAEPRVYQVAYSGRRDFQASFHHRGRQIVSSKDQQVALCLDLMPLTNYSITVSELSSHFTASVRTCTPLTAPPTPEVSYTEVESTLPTLFLHRSADTLELISVYQVFVLPVVGAVLFNCSSPPPLQHLVAQWDLRRVGSEVSFTVGDGRYYGGMFNAPLETGRNYYVVLRAVRRWKTESQSSCILWAKVLGTAFALRVASLGAAACVALLLVISTVGYNLTRWWKRR